MKKFDKYLLFIPLLFNLKLNAQIGIQTNNPKTTLDIKESRINGINDPSLPDGLMIPTLSKKDLAAKATSVYTQQHVGTKIFVNDISGTISGPSINRVRGVLEKGFYYLNNNLIWELLTNDSSNDSWVNNPNASRVELATNSFGNARINNSSVVVTDDGNLGINNNSPLKRIDINASTIGNTTDNIKILNLKEFPASTNTSTLVMDNNGYIYKNEVENLNGQIMRIPIVGFTPGGVNNELRQGSIRLSFDNTITSPACTTNCNPNFINTIKGINNTHLLVNQLLIAGTGTNIRTTERIVLPKGTFKVQVRLVGYYSDAFTPTPINTINSYNPGTTIVKLSIGNNEFSLTNYFESTYGTSALTSIVYTEFISLVDDAPARRTLDLLMDPITRNFTIVPDETVNGKKIVKSMLLIEKIR